MSETHKVTAEEARVLTSQQEENIGWRLTQIYARIRIAAEVPEFAIFMPRLEGEPQAGLRRAGVVLERDGFETIWLEASDGLLVRWDTE